LLLQKAVKIDARLPARPERLAYERLFRIVVRPVSHAPPTIVVKPSPPTDDRVSGPTENLRAIVNLSRRNVRFAADAFETPLQP
jgi:hypothetical protein